ncbi:orexin receptor type 1-like [Exaiptasia diaphana]|uniref:G-protein coupled receptors family 1 profile domain-containing protein n=1 Tax=Exaiptasia diaphana TaxID=2652724 RepID=A0A913XPH1_EXADI|nr:orexin receptor type 1-like [Exaiptasia diaphana]
MERPRVMATSTGTTLAANITKMSTNTANKQVSSGGFESTKITFYFVILFCSTFGNGMLVYIISSTRKMRTATNYLILNLAICDFLTPILSIPFDFALEENNHQWMYGVFMCKFLSPAATFTVTSSALNLAIISLDRYRNIMHPYKPRLTSKQITCSICGLYCVSALCVAPYIYVLRLKGESCLEVWGHFLYRQIYTLFLFLVQYALPLVFMAVMYSLALFHLYHSSGRTQKMRLQKKQHEFKRSDGCIEGTCEKPRPLLRSLSIRSTSILRAHTKANKRATKMFLTVVTVFTIFMLPNQVVWLWSDFGGGLQSNSFNKTVIICWLFTYANCVSNPIIFAVFSNDFRYGFLKVFHRSSYKNYFDSNSVIERRNSAAIRIKDNDNNTGVTHVTDLSDRTAVKPPKRYFKRTTYC